MFARAEESALLLRMMREAVGILGARWDKVPERQRPHYVAEQRFRILRIRSFLGLSQRETAEMFRVSTETIARWEMETTRPDEEAPRHALRPLVAPNPLVRRFADVVRMLVKTMELAGFGGNDLIARAVAEDLMAKSEMGLLHYAHFRPHQGIGGATPAEVYFARTPAHLAAIPPPRESPREGPMDSPFRVEYLDVERLLPMLVRKAA
jgi:transcriptional regulator with XRE-family HTH domain